MIDLPFQVSWMRLRDINVMAMNEVTNTKDKRIRAIHVPESDRWALRIEEAKLSDEGGYECQVTTTNKTILIVYLTVLGQSFHFYCFDCPWKIKLFFKFFLFSCYLPKNTEHCWKIYFAIILNILLNSEIYIL
jgi:hypothetical protein